ncbi:MAG: hypothetical protein ABFD50_18070 [Smithella sp.]
MTKTGSKKATENETTNLAKDAIIFIPGLGRDYLDQSVDCISRKIANSLDRNAKDIKATYLAVDSPDEEYREGLKTKKRTIIRKDHDSEQPFTDLYELNYEDIFMKRYKEKTPIYQVLALGGTLLSNIVRIPYLLRGYAKSRREKFQIFFSLGILLIMIIYALLLVTAAASAIPGLNDIIQKYFSLEILHKGIIIVTGLGLFTSLQLKNLIRDAAVDYSCAIDYLSLGERRRAIIGQLSLLVEHIRELYQYEKIHVISYSFGSLIALDALYPNDEYSCHHDNIDSLVTIGCPFDLVRNCWPEYFKERICSGNLKRRWLNMYNPVDLLGSNFRNDEKIKEAETGIEVQSGNQKDILMPENLVIDKDLYINGLSLVNLLCLRGLKVHSCYWDPDDKAEISCFDKIIGRLYPDL